MHVAVTCPRCQSHYQLDPGLVGKRMRCPNTLCRAIFEVRPDDAPSATAAAPPRAEPAPPRAEPVAPPPSPPRRRPEVILPSAPAPGSAPTPIAWHEGPPPIRATVAAPAPTSAPAVDDLPGDFPDDAADDANVVGEAPPSNVIQAAWEGPAEPAAQATAAAAAPFATPTPHRRRWPLMALAVMVLVMVGAGAAVWWAIAAGRARGEQDRFERALALYADRRFGEAAELLRRLYGDFPDSPQRATYDFLRELSSVREAAYAPTNEGASSVEALRSVIQFLRVYQNEPQLKDRHGDVWATLHHLAGRLANEAEQTHDPAALRDAERAWAEAEKFRPPAEVSLAEAKRKLQERFAEVGKAQDVHARHEQLLDALRAAVEEPSALAVREARALSREAGLAEQADVKTLLHKLVEAHRERVRYIPAGVGETIPMPQDDRLPSLFFAPALGKVRAAPDAGSVVLALARGVLYAQEPTRGEVLWAHRVGADAHTLPLRVPPDPIAPELLLAVSPDSRSVVALVARTGKVVWRCSLSSPCLGRPVLVGRRLLVPTLGGRVEEVEISGGRRLGAYQLGQPLIAGGVRQPGTSLVWFPADEYCVYALDAAKRTCVAVLYTGHAAGALRDVPTFLPGEPTPGIKSAGPAGWLLLCLARGAGETELRPYALPIRDPDQPPTGPSATVRGWASTAPWYRAGTLALATDAGTLGLWGVRLPGNRDPLLFSYLEDASFAVDDGAEQTRSRLAHSDADNYWVLTRGRMHRLQATFDGAKGPGLLPRWPQPPSLGTPLHACQARSGRDGQTVLYVATQRPDRPSCLSSALDAKSGALLWQRQLGGVALRPPIVLGQHVLLRAAGGLLRFDAEKLAKADAPWQAAGELLLAEPLAGARLLLLTDGREAVQLTWPPPGAGPVTLTLRRIRPGAAESVTTRTIELPAAPHGSAALADGAVLLPLANGVAARLRLDDGTLALGPDWRAAGADAEALGHVVALGGGDWLMTDGSRTLTRLHWPGKAWEPRGSAELTHRLVAPPALLPAAEDAAPRVAVADAEGTVTLLDGARLQVVRRWALGGPVTLGPFTRSGRLGVVVGKDRLVWLDPQRDRPLWQYTFAAAIAGPPPLVDGALIVADLAGQFLALDPADGRPRGPGYTLRADVVPSAAPAPLPGGRLFVPLSDGTVVLLPPTKRRADATGR